MEKTIKKFSDKQNFTKIKAYFNKNIDNNKIVVSNKVSFYKRRFRYFIGYNDA